MNAPYAVNEVEVERALRAMLQRMDSVRDVEVARQVVSADTAIDFIASFRRGKTTHHILVETKR